MKKQKQRQQKNNAVKFMKGPELFASVFLAGEYVYG